MISARVRSVDQKSSEACSSCMLAPWYFVKDYPLGEFIGSLWGVHVYARDFGKNEIALARYLRGVGFKLCNVPRKSCSLESEVGFKALQRNLRNHDRQSFAGLLVLRQGLSPWGVHWESMGSSRVRQGFREK